MTFGNVIPIDAEVARQLARRQVAFRWLVAGLTALWLAVLVPTVLFTPLPPLAPFLALAALVMLAEHRFVLFGDETSMSASIIVIVASIFVFSATAPLAGPLLIASIGGIYIPHLRSRSVALPLANASIFGLSAAVAAGIASRSSALSTLTVPQTVGVVTVASVVYWYANSVLVGVAGATRLSAPIIDSVRNQAASDWSVILLAVGSGLVARAAGASTVRMVVGVAVVICMFEIYRRALRLSSNGASATRVHSCGTALGVVAAICMGSLLGAALAFIAVFVVVENPFPHEHRHWRTAVVAACVLAIGCAAQVLSVPGYATFIACTAVGTGALAFTTLIARCRSLGLRVPTVAGVGILIPGRAGVIYFGAVATALALTEHVVGQSHVVVACVAMVPVLATLVSTGYSGRLRGATHQRSLVTASR